MIGRLRLKRFCRMSVFVTLFLCLAMATTVLSQEEIKIGGVGSAMGSMKLIGRAFEKNHPAAKVRVLSSLGSSGAMKALSKNAIDIAVVSRELTDDEKKQGFASIPFARSPFIFIAHRDVAISNITLDEIVKIYEGRAMTWPNGKRVRMVLRPSADTDTLIAKNISPALERALVGAAGRPGMLTALTDQDLLDTVESTPGAFGFSSLTIVLVEGRKVNVLSYNGMKPAGKNLSSGSYPFWKPFGLVARRDPSGLVQSFLAFMRSSGARRILENTGYLTTD